MNNALGTAAGSTTVEPGATLDLPNVAYATAEPVTLDGGTLSASTGTTSFAGAVTLTADSLLGGAPTTAFTLNGTVSGAANKLAITMTSGTVTFANTVTLGTLTTVGNAYNVAFNGATTTVTNAVAFLNTGTVTLGNGGDTLTFTGGIQTEASATNPSQTNLGGIIKTVDQPIDLGPINVVSASTLITHNGSGGPGAAITVASVTGAAALSLIPRSATATVSGALTLTSTLTLEDTDTQSTGSVIFNGLVTLTTLSTASAGYAVTFNAGGTISTAATFTNTGTLTIAAGLTFAAGATASSGPKSIAGVIQASGTTTLDFGTTATTAAGDATLQTSGAGTVILDGTTVTNTFTLTLGNGSATTITTNAINGTGPNANLTINSAGAVTIGGNVGPSINTIDVVNANGLTFNGTVTATSLSFDNTITNAATMAFNGLVTLTNMSAALAVGVPYSITLGAGGSVTSAVTLSNTGTLTVGAAGFAFNGGTTKLAGPKSFEGGTISAGNQPLNFGTAGNVTLTATTTFNAGSGAITLFAIPGPANVNLVIQGSGTDSLATVGLGTGTLDLSGMLAGGSVTVSGALTANALTTTNTSYAITLNGGGTIATAVTFSNTGLLTIGAAGMTFSSGATDTAGGKSFSGTITATGANNLDFGGTATTIPAAAATVLRTTGAATLTLAGVTIGAGGSLTFGNGNATTVNVTGAIDGTATSGLAINTTAGVTISGAVGATAMNTVTVTQSGGTAFGSTVNAATVTLTDTTATQTIQFSGNLTATTGMSAAAGAAYNVSLLGATNTIAGATVFANTGTLTITTTTTTFSGGVTATGTSAASLSGTIAATAGVINLGGGPITINGTVLIGGTSTGQITLSAVTIASGAALTLGGGAATPIATSTIDGTSAGAQNLTIDTTGTATIGGALGGTVPLGTLTNSSASGTVDVQANNFSIGTLANSGTFSLQGTQTTQTITTMNMGGTVQYYGAGPGTIRLSTFYSLTVTGSGTFTLNQPITVGPATGGGLLTISGTATLDVSGSSRPITIYGSWTNTAGTAHFVPRAGTVTFAKPSGTITVLGDNTWYDFEAILPGVTFAFEAAKTQTFIAGGNFGVQGISGTDVILTSTSTVQWIISLDATATVQPPTTYATVTYSNATASSPIVVDATVTIDATDSNWLHADPVLWSKAEDSDNNGKIDRIHVRVAAPINHLFGGFTASVSGYTVKNYADQISFSFDFYINLYENTFLDTNAVPTWTISANSSLRSSSGTQTVIILSPPASSTDAAPPVVAYTLAVVGSNQLFVQFSEPVFETVSPTQLALTDFTFYNGGTQDATLNPTARSFPASGEVLLTLGRVLTADDITTPIMMRVANAVDAVPLTPNALTIPATGHRISDIGLGLPGASLFEPVWARDTSIRSATSGIGYITTFDGTKWLRTGENLTLEGNISTLSIASYPTNGQSKLLYDMNVSSSLATSSGLWLPGFTDDTTVFGGFSGLVPTAKTGDTSARTIYDTSQPSTRLRDFVIPGSDAKDVDGATLDFLFSIPQGTSTLYTASVPDPSADSAWYQHLKPWAFDLHTVKTQRGGVSILNNVINPDKGDAATLQYYLGSAGQVTVMVFDLSGSIVNVLVRGTQSAGEYETLWNGTNRAGTKVARGIYFVRIVGPDIDEIRKVLVVR